MDDLGAIRHSARGLIAIAGPFLDILSSPTSAGGHVMHADPALAVVTLGMADAGA